MAQADGPDPLVARPPGPVQGAVILGTAVLVVAVDQVTKSLALHHLTETVDGSRIAQSHHVFASLYLSLTFNQGIAFGLGRGARPIIETVVVVLIAALVVFGRRAARHSSLVEAVGVGLLIGGACGNLADRVFRPNDGAVIDFINIAQIHGREYWPVFNVADMCVVVGAVLLAWHYAFGAGRRLPVGPGQPVDAAHEAGD